MNKWDHNPIYFILHFEIVHAYLIPFVYRHYSMVYQIQYTLPLNAADFQEILLSLY